jgi:hypothetical protein
VPPTKEEIDKIIKLHEGGYSQREIAKEFDKSVGWVNGILKSLNIQSERSWTKNATAAKKNYDRAARLDLNNYLFNKICEMSKETKSPSDLKNLIISYGILSDKRELIEPPVPLKTEDDGFFSELECKAEEVWQDIDAQDISVSMDTPKPQAMANPNLVDKSFTDTES